VQSGAERGWEIRGGRIERKNNKRKRARGGRGQKPRSKSSRKRGDQQRKHNRSLVGAGKH